MSNKQLVIIGAGGHAKVVLDTAYECGWQNIMVLDDYANDEQSLLDLPITGKSDLIGNSILPSQHILILAIGNNSIRAKMHQQFKQQGFDFATLIHPRAIVSRFAQIEEGSVVFAQAVIQAQARIGKSVIINTAASIDHDCCIDDFAHISPHAALAGNTHIGTQTWVGIGAVTRQGIHIGRCCIIGAASAVVSNIADGIQAYGVPAKAQKFINQPNTI